MSEESKFYRSGRWDRDRSVEEAVEQSLGYQLGLSRAQCESVDLILLRNWVKRGQSITHPEGSPIASKKTEFSGNDRIWSTIGVDSREHISRNTGIYLTICFTRKKSIWRSMCNRNMKPNNHFIKMENDSLGWWKRPWKAERGQWCVVEKVRGRKDQGDGFTQEDGKLNRLNSKIHEVCRHGWEEFIGFEFGNMKALSTKWKPRSSTEYKKECWRCSTVVEYLSSIHKALGSVSALEWGVGRGGRKKTCRFEESRGRK